MATVIKCIVPDKRVVEVIRLLRPFALDPPVVDPMDDASPQSPAVRQRTEPGAIKEMIFDHISSLAKSGVKTVTARQLRDFCISNGAQHNSYSYPLKLLLTEGALKKSKLPSTYEVVK